MTQAMLGAVHRSRWPYRQLEEEIHSVALSHPHSLNVNQRLPVILVKRVETFIERLARKQTEHRRILYFCASMRDNIQDRNLAIDITIAACQLLERVEQRTLGTVCFALLLERHGVFVQQHAHKYVCGRSGARVTATVDLPLNVR